MTATPTPAPCLAWPLRLLLAGTVGLVLAVAVGLLLFTHPMSDDLCNVVSARERGLLGALRHEYLHWGGRWASLLPVVGFPALIAVRPLYPAVLLALLVLHVLSLRQLVGSALLRPGQGRLGWVLTLALVAIWWAGLPHPGQSLYWLEGAMVYSLNVSLLLLVLAGLARLSEAPGRRRGVATLLLALLAFVAAAFHELIALLFGAAFLTGAAVARLGRDPRWTAWAAASAATALGLATVVLAPGNEVRQELALANGRSLLRSAEVTLLMWLRVLDVPVIRGDPPALLSPLGWILDPRLLGASVLFVTSEPLASLRPGWVERHGWVLRWAAPAVGALALTGSFTAVSWMTSRTLPLRAFNALYLVFLLTWFLTLFLHTRSGALDLGEPAVRVLQGLGALVLALGLLFSTNLKLAARDLATGRLAAFDREMSRRSTAARELAAQGGGELVAKRIDPWPSIFFENDLEEVRINVAALRECALRFYGVDRLRFVDDPDRPAHPPRRAEPEH